jgi:hypothetical protein
MAARKRKITLSDDWKAKIKASQLVNRLYDHALGENEMNATQIKAAQIVLNKLVPDLNRSELSGPDGGAIEQHMRVTFE